MNLSKAIPGADPDNQATEHIQQRSQSSAPPCLTMPPSLARSARGGRGPGRSGLRPSRPAGHTTAHLPAGSPRRHPQTAGRIPLYPRDPVQPPAGRLLRDNEPSKVALAAAFQRAFQRNGLTPIGGNGD